MATFRYRDKPMPTPNYDKRWSDSLDPFADGSSYRFPAAPKLIPRKGNRLGRLIDKLLGRKP